MFIRLWSSGVGQPAGCKQSAAKGSQPIDSTVGKGLWSLHSPVAKPNEIVLVKMRIGNVHPPVDHHLVPQASTGVDPGNTGASAQAIIKHRGFDASPLGGMRDFIFPGAAFTEGNILHYISAILVLFCL